MTEAGRPFFESDPSLVVLKRHAYEGCVTGVDIGRFTARLVSAYGELNEGVAEYDLDAVTADDRPLIVLGALFYALHEVVLTPSGRMESHGRIRIRRVDDDA